MRPSMSWNHLVPAGPPDLTGVTAPADVARACVAAAIVSGSSAVAAPLAAHADAFRLACATESAPREVIALGLGLVMLACAGAAVELSCIEPASARASATATPSEALRLALLAAASGAFGLSSELWTPHGEVEDRVADLARCIIDGPLDGLREPWECFLGRVPADADTAVDVMLIATAAQLRVHLLTVERAKTLDALARELGARR